MQLRVLVPLIALLASTFVLPAASLGQESTTPDLAVYAGDSRVLVGDSSATVDATPIGGQEPYTFTWTIDGSEDRFSRASDGLGIVDLSGLTGDVDIHVEVEDAGGQTATDTVRYHRVAKDTLLEVEDEVGPPLPVELFASNETARNHTFDVPTGTAELVATLSWKDVQPTLLADDLDLRLFDPSGQEVAAGDGATTSNPERIELTDPEAGEWTARVEHRLGEGGDYDLGVSAFQSEEPVPDVPDAIPRGKGVFATLDDQVLHAEIRQADPATSTIAWDLGIDGTADVTGQHPTVDLPLGEHEIAVRIVDEEGLQHRRTTTVTVTDEAEHTLGLLCVDRMGWDANTMEWSLSGDTCWMHGGHHTYVLDETYTLVGGEGIVVSVEQELSPPTELNATGLESPIHVQTSMDGQTWTDVDTIAYDYYDTIPASRNKIQATLGPSEEPFRYIRFHEPRSAAQGLSGFLDNTKFVLLVNGSDANAPADPVEQGQVSLSCLEGDHMEDFFASHPCWFGGINRYDAPSFYHTYELGRGSTVEAVEATVEVAPWRTDDWFLPIVVSDDAERMQGYAGQATNTTVFVETSPDGQTWTRIGSKTVLFGQPALVSIDLEEPEPARFVRVVPDLHPEFDNFRAQPALHHPEAFITFSELTVDL